MKDEFLTSYNKKYQEIKDRCILQVKGLRGAWASAFWYRCKDCDKVYASGGNWGDNKDNQCPNCELIDFEEWEID